MCRAEMEGVGAFDMTGGVSFALQDCQEVCRC